MPALETALDSWDTRIPTGKFNALLAELAAEHPHPVRGGKQPRILFGTQAATRPPTFVLFTTGFLDPGYRRFIQRRLREIYGFEGTPIVDQHARARAAPALAQRMTRRGRFFDFWLRTGSHAHGRLLTVSRWRLGAGVVGMPVVMLVHDRSTQRTASQRGAVGSRRRWRPRSCSSPRRVATTGTRSGTATWSRTRRSSSRCAARPSRMTARTADAAERAELWPRVVGAYDGYAEYQRRTTRQIPLVICEPDEW